ncbi:hypothetical protein SDC9_93486 [bioreactor metagenome]|jgi:hypothetical protein|uniref:Uncharacterized protein n=2 Tax=root TaxID=1 RepID=A0A562JC86_9FIRM|nr:hypothetical protein [Sedimentibacter saalensis]MEA5095270.1 hypothetical protein [Sedimentibacter saalensis]TWH80760.1 hypothetical protein LY60_02022 [Sedimentibacter saalensis]
MECPFCCFLKNYTGRFVGIGFVCNCCLDTTQYNHVYGFGYLRRRSFYGDSIRLYDAPRDGNVIFTANCDDIFEVYFPPNDANGPMSMEELKTIVEEKEKNSFSRFVSTKGGEGK